MRQRRKPRAAQLGVCIEWDGWRANGYGITRDRRKAHRVAYEREHGSVPRGYVVHHVCENTLCVNPAHLEAMPPGDHTRLHRPGDVRHANARALTRCLRGHLYDKANTYVNARGHRSCRICRTEAQRACRERRRAA